MFILAIDPGDKASAFVAWNSLTKTIYEANIVKNIEMLAVIESFQYHVEEIVIEMIASYGMPVGKEVFDTCLWIGRFYQKAFDCYHEPKLVFRKDIKIWHCYNMKAKDGNVAQALRDKYGEKGTKKKPGLFYGFKDDMWQAFAVATYWSESKATGI